MKYCFYHKYFKKSVLYGLFVFNIFPLSAQTDLEKETMMPKIDSIMDRHYFSNADSALYHLNKYKGLAEQNSWKEPLLYAILNKAYVAEHHYMIDSLGFFLQQGDSLIQLYKKNIGQETFDPNTALAREFPYMNGMYNYYQGDFKQAANLFQQIIFENGELIIADSLQTFNSLINIGQLYSYDQDYSSAEQFYNMALNTLPSSSNQYDLIRDYNYQLGFIEMLFAKAIFYKNKGKGDMKDYKQVISSLRKALTKLSGKENEPGTHNLFLNIYGLLADVFMEIENFNNASLYINKGIEISKGADLEQQIKFLYKAGKIYSETGDRFIADEYITKGQNLTNEEFPGKHRLKAIGYYERGALFSRQNRWNDAIQEYQKALFQLSDGNLVSQDIYQTPDADSITLQNEFLKIMLAKADALQRWYKQDPSKKRALEASIDTYEKATNLIDEIRKSYQSGEAKQFLSSIMVSSYENAIEACYDAYTLTSNESYLEKAFFFAEKNKGNQLTDVIKDLSSKSFSDIPDELLEAEKRMKGRIFYWQNAFKDGAQEEKDKAKVQLFEVQEKYKLFIGKLEKDYPKYYQLKYQPYTISISEVQNELIKDKKSVLIEFFYGENNIYVFGISPTKVIVNKIPVNNIFNFRFKEFLSSLSSPTSKTLDKSLEDLTYYYTKFIGPVEDVLSPEINKIIVIPDAFLGYLPFETLVRGNPDKENFLVLDYNVSYDYSATLMKEKQLLPERVLDYNYVGFAPNYETGQETGSRALLSNLKFNRKEVEDAQGIFGGKKFLNERATEQNFMDFAQDGKILHLSMHAKADDENPTSSAFYFNKESPDQIMIKQNEFDENDGVLHLYELYNYPLKAQLAVLSACETGSGEFTKGEGIMSLGRAFQYAGCPSVVMSLWQINDMTSASIMKDFFHNLKKGEAKDEALRNAKIAFLSSEKNKFFLHPYYWSAFVLVGDSNPVTENDFSFIVVVSIVLSALVIFFIIFWFKKKGKQVYTEA